MIDIYCVIWMGLFLAFADMVSICSLLCVSAMCAIKMRNEGSTFYAFVFKIESWWRYIFCPNSHRCPNQPDVKRQ